MIAVTLRKKKNVQIVEGGRCLYPHNHQRAEEKETSAAALNTKSVNE